MKKFIVVMSNRLVEFYIDGNVFYIIIEVESIECFCILDLQLPEVVFVNMQWMIPYVVWV